MGHVSSASDTGNAVGVRAYSNDTHTGGDNIGLYANATGSTVGNYALYLKNGDALNFGAMNWSFGGAITYVGAYDLAVPQLNITSLLKLNGSQGTSGQVLTSAGSGSLPTWTTPATGTVTSVTGTAPVVSSGGTTPPISMAAANTSTNGYLTSTDWNTFNSKAAPFTYTTSYIPYGQGTTTPNQSSSLTFASSTLTAPIVSASNGLVVNSNTVSASYTIPTGSSASSVGPMTVASGQSVTVPSGSRWVVL